MNQNNPVRVLNSKAGHGMFDGLPPINNQGNNYADSVLGNFRGSNVDRTLGSFSNRMR